MNRFKLYLNDTNTENQKKCVKILFKHFNCTFLFNIKLFKFVFDVNP